MRLLVIKLVEAESWTIESNCLSPVEAKYTATESKRISLSVEVTNWAVEAKCLTVILSSYISVIREYTGQFLAYVSSTPIMQK